VLFPDLSVAVKVTTVVPAGKTPGAFDVTTGEGSAISEADALNATTVPAGLSCSTVMLAGTRSTGGVVSCTVTLTVSDPVFPPSSVTVSVTTVLPAGKCAVKTGPFALLPFHVQ